MVEVRFKPADVGTVADGSVTTVKLADEAVVDAKVKSDAGIAQSKVANLPADLAGKVGTGPLSGDKKVTALGWDSSTEEIIVDHEA